MSLENALKQLHEAAKEHKRLSARHRRIARNIMRSIAEIQEELSRRYGIEFQYIPPQSDDLDYE
jgi:hypothetical protein